MVTRSLLAIGLLACHSSPPDVLDRTLVPIGGRAVDGLELSTPDGATYTASDLIGRWTVVAFGYTSCPDVCPSTLLGVSDALDRWQADGRAVDTLFVAVDPTHDAPVLEAYLDHFHPSLKGATGTDTTLQQAAAALGASFRIATSETGERRVDHSTSVFVVDPQGVVAAVHTRPSDGELLAREVGAFIDGWEPTLRLEGWIRRPPPGAGAAAGYGTFHSAATAARSIAALRSPQAESIHTHETVQADGVAYMQPATFRVDAHGEMALTPGGRHLMIGGLDPDAPELDLHLTLDDGTTLWARLPVRSR